MEQLTLQDLLNMIVNVSSEGLMLSAVPIYIGNENLSEIHNAHYMTKLEGNKEILDRMDNPNENGIVIN